MPLSRTQKRAPSRQSLPFGPDSARTKLRAALMAHIHQQETPAQIKKQGGSLARWLPNAGHNAQENLKLLVGDPITLIENLKILRQYSKLLSHACHYAPAHPDDQPIPAHAQPLSRCPPDAAYPPHLQWFQHLADRPYRGLDAAADARIHTLLKLHLAVQPSEKQKKSPQQQAYELALSLPHYDRDLTAFYLSTAPPDHEYELEVAHSIMRLHAPPTPPALAHWRQQGLLHVLHVAAVNMPDHAQDWGLPAHQPLRDLLAVLNHPSPQSPAERLEAIQRFVAAHDPSQPASQHVASCLDRLAVLMGVKSNAPTPEKHDLAACLAAFPHLEALQAASTWATIKSALENALPPSLLLLDATCAKRRIKQADGTW